MSPTKSSSAYKFLKVIIIAVVVIAALGGLTLLMTGGGVLARWSPFLLDCEKIQTGDTMSELTNLMKKYIDDPRYNYMTNTNETVTTISLADDQGFHMKTWRCLVELRDNTVTSVDIST
jgi:hypothetical protein